MSTYTVISDSHGNYEAVYNALRFPETKSAVFLGDGVPEFLRAAALCAGIETWRVFGNSDTYHESGIPASLMITDRDTGIKIFAAHGHYQRVGAELGGIANAAKENGASIALFGHLHTRIHTDINGVELFCPGSISRPRDGKPPSFGIMRIDGGGVNFKWIDASKN